MMDDTTVLRAIEDIRALKARYFRHVDFKEWGDYAGLFAPDLVVYAPDGSEASRGGPEFAANVQAFLHPAVTIHHGFVPEIDILGPAEARGLWPMHDILTWADGAPGKGFTRMEGWGHYHETYRKIGDAWRIASLKLTRLRVETT